MSGIELMMTTTALIVALFFLMTPIALTGLALWKHAASKTKHERFCWRLAIGNALQRTSDLIRLPSQLWTRWMPCRWTGPGFGRARLANIAEGTFKATVNKLSDAAIATRHLLYTFGSDADHIAPAGVNDFALGTVDDEVASANLTDQWLGVNLLGRGPAKRMVASAAIAAGGDVYQGAAGKVAPTGFRYLGRALTAASGDGDILLVDDQAPARCGGLFNLIAAAVAAAGTTVADAAQLGNAFITHVSSDGAAKGVKLPAGVAGMAMIVINTTATASELYAATGGTVNGLAADASVVLPASKGLLCVCTAANTWTVFDLTAKATAS